MYLGNRNDSLGTKIPDDYTLANIVAGIAGGVEAPLQFIFQVDNPQKQFLSWHYLYREYELPMIIFHVLHVENL